MLPLVAALTLLAPAEPVDTLKSVRDHYRSLKSFSMTIEHNGSSGLFPGEFTQTMRWQQGGRFELLVTRPNPKGADNRAPDYYANGAEVLSIRPNGSHSRDGIMPDPNTSPGWEVSGGMIMSWLQDTRTGKMILDPPKEMPIVWSFGPRSEWRKLKVRELVGTMKSPRGSQTVNFFIDEVKRALVGFEYDFGRQKGYAIYKDQKFNVALPATLGNGP
jgi:hypothetical protein